jgi:hypothetical protein
MANIKRALTSGITKTGTAVADVPDTPTIGTATAAGLSASVTFTPAVTGGTPSSYTVTSSPGGFTGTGASAPITVSGLSDGTSYTFTVTATNAKGTSPASSASNSITAAAPMEGAYDSLATVTLSSTTTYIDITDIPTGYTHLEIYCSLRTDANTNGGNSVLMQFNGDTGNNYSRHFFGAYTGSSSGVDIAAGSSQGSINTHVAPASNNLSTVWGAGFITILDYASDSKYKVSRSIGGYSQNGASGYDYIHQMSGGWYSLSPVVRVRLLAAGSFVSGSTVEVYGVK